MAAPRCLSSLMLILALLGCGTGRTGVPAAETPLTLEQWRTMPTQLEYEVETLERLKQGSPKLQEQREWDKFTRDVLLPSKKKDRPSGRPS